MPQGRGSRWRRRSGSVPRCSSVSGSRTRRPRPRSSGPPARSGARASSSNDTLAGRQRMLPDEATRDGHATTARARRPGGRRCEGAGSGTPRLRLRRERLELADGVAQTEVGLAARIRDIDPGVVDDDAPGEAEVGVAGADLAEAADAAAIGAEDEDPGTIATPRTLGDVHP